MLSKRRFVDYTQKKNEAIHKEKYLELAQMETNVESIFRNSRRITEVGFDEGGHLLKLREIAPDRYADISSHYFWTVIVSGFIPTDYCELNTVKVESLDGYFTGWVDLYRLPFHNQSVSSLSYMRVREHAGLDRYGDSLDCNADLKAITGPKRVTASAGHILFVVPAGDKPVVAFNGPGGEESHTV